MAVNIEVLNWLLSRVGYQNDWSILDVGESCVVHSTVDDIGHLVYNVGGKVYTDEVSESTIADFSSRSYQIGNPAIPTTFLSEVFSFAQLKYEAIDVVIARNAQRIDLNFQNASDVTGGPFDLIMNFGTTEHLINQFNAFKVFHELTRPGGYMFHMVPLVGYLDHGYFSYKPMFFADLAKANNYEIVDMWAFGPQGSERFAPLVETYGMDNAVLPYNNVGLWMDAQTPAGVIATLFRKKSEGDFRVSLELKTSAALE